MAKKQKNSKKPVRKVFRVLNIVKNIILGIILAFLAIVLVAVLTAHFNGETPKLFGHAIYRVSSGSMRPYLQVGDIILCADCDPMELKVGDIITYNGKIGQFKGKKVTHRVYTAPYFDEKKGKYCLVTKGDNNPVEDSPIGIDQVTGKYIQKIDLLKHFYDFFITPWGLLTLIGLIVLAFFNEIVNFARALAGHDDDDEDHEDIQDIIARIQKESAEEEKKKQAEEEKCKNDNGVSGDKNEPEPESAENEEKSAEQETPPEAEGSADETE